MKERTVPILREIFNMLTVAVAVFVVMEIAKSGLVLAYINLNWVLILWAIVGIVILLIKEEKYHD